MRSREATLCVKPRVEFLRGAGGRNPGLTGFIESRSPFRDGMEVVSTQGPPPRAVGISGEDDDNSQSSDGDRSR